MCMLVASNFELSFPTGTENAGKLLMEALEDYLKSMNYNAEDYDELMTAEHMSKMLFELKHSSYGGTAKCYITMFALEQLVDIVLKYRDKKSVNFCECSHLWIVLKDMLDRAKDWKCY